MAEKIKEVKAAELKGPQARSALANPYFDLDSSIKVADVVLNEGGGVCSPDLLAARLEYASTRSGTYLTRVSAARHFGLIATSGSNFIVTERGKLILSPVMPEDAQNAKVEAFLSVPLFAKVYEAFKGQQLPPEVGLKNLFQNTYQIVPDRVAPAVRIFLSSAEQAGFFRAGKTRLIRPSAQVASPPASDITPPPATPVDTPPASERRGGNGGDGGGIHSALIGLLRELPKSGQSWSSKEQEDFIAAFTGLIKFIFPAKGDGKPYGERLMAALDKR